MAVSFVGLREVQIYRSRDPTLDLTGDLDLRYNTKISMDFSEDNLLRLGEQRF